MGDAIQSHIGSVRKGNAEVVAKRRAAIQQEIQQRVRTSAILDVGALNASKYTEDQEVTSGNGQKLARKLQDEKIARAVAQKEERLLKQREAQQREMLRAKAVLDRRTQILAEREKEKKEAVLAKVHALASRLTTQNRSRSLYAFGSSTPRELEYLTQLTREQKVYDRKPLHSGRCVPSATSGSSSHSTLTPPCDLRPSVTGILYVTGSELKKSRRRTSNFMTQSMMIERKPNKPTKFHQLSASSVIEVQNVPNTTKKLIQQPVSPRYRQGPRSVHSKPEAMIGVLKTELVSREVRNPNELKANEEIKAEVVLEKPLNDQMNETAVKSVAVEVLDANEKMKTTGSASKVVGSDVRDPDMENKIIFENELTLITEVTVVEDVPLLYISSEQEDNFVNEAKATAAAIVNLVVAQEANIREKHEMESNVLEELGGTVCLASLQTELVHNQKENGAQVLVQEKSLTLSESFPETGNSDRQEAMAIQKPCEIAEDEKESNISTAEINVNLVEGKTEFSAQDNATINTVGTEIVVDLKLTEEKRLVEEKRRIQDELLEREQREREMRKAKLASIMSRTRGGAPPVSATPGVPAVPTVSPALHNENSEVGTLKCRTDVPSSSEYTPSKNVLSHTAASVLQKLATTNPKLLSVLQRNGSNQSLAEELSAADPSMSVTLPEQSADSIASHGTRHLHFEPDVNHRPVAMK